MTNSANIISDRAMAARVPCAIMPNSYRSDEFGGQCDIISTHGHDGCKGAVCVLAWERTMAWWNARFSEIRTESPRNMSPSAAVRGSIATCAAAEQATSAA